MGGVPAAAFVSLAKHYNFTEPQTWIGRQGGLAEVLFVFGGFFFIALPLFMFMILHMADEYEDRWPVSSTAGITDFQMLVDGLWLTAGTLAGFWAAFLMDPGQLLLRRHEPAVVLSDEALMSPALALLGGASVSLVSEGLSALRSKFL
jgi:hypothetical protein